MTNTADRDLRAQKFFEEILETGAIHFIKTKDEQLLLCPSSKYIDPETKEELAVIPVWSETFISHAKKYADDLEVVECGFEQFFYDVLPRMRNDGVSIGINWDEEGIGSEFQTSDVIRIIARLMNQKREPENNLKADKFFEDALKTKKVFYLVDKDTEQVFICPSYEAINEETKEPIPVIPLWSESYLDLAKTYVGHLELDEMELDILKNDLLQDMHKDGILVGINLDESGFGLETSASLIIRKLGGVIKQ